MLGVSVLHSSEFLSQTDVRAVQNLGHLEEKPLWFRSGVVTLELLLVLGLTLFSCLWVVLAASR